MRIAILENQDVTNIVFGDPEVVANLFPNTQKETPETGTPSIGAKFVDGKFYQYPTDGKAYSWDEETISWVQIQADGE